MVLEAYRNSIAVALVLTVVSAALALAEGEEPELTLWRGTIGNAAVVVEIKELRNDKGSVVGRYFEESQLHDHFFDGSRDSGEHLHLGVKREVGDDEVLARFDLESREGELVGEWQGAQEKRESVRLRRVDVSALRAGKEGDRYRRGGVGDYDALRLSGLELERGGSTSFAGHQLRSWREPKSGIELFQIESGYDAATLARLNAVLSARLWKEAADALECVSAEGANERDPDDKQHYVLKAEPRYLDARYLSVGLTVSFFCVENMHPYSGDHALNLDVRSGRELALEDVLWLGAGDPPRAGSESGSDEGSRRLYEYRKKILSPWIVATFRKLYPDRLQEDCNYDDHEVWPGSWYLLRRGVYLHAFFPAMDEQCDNPPWSVVPWELVRKHPGPALRH